MKVLILLAVVAAASAVPYFPYNYNYGTYGYGRDLYSDNIDYRTLMLGGRTHILDKDITLVKKDFVIFYYKYLVELLDIFHTRFHDILSTVDVKTHSVFGMPMYCNKMTGLMQWMMMMNIDFTTYDPHYFDMFMWCKISDYMMYMKYYWLHFNFVDVMHTDLPFMRDMFHGLGYNYLHKFGDYYGKSYDGLLGNKFYGNLWYGQKYLPFGEKFTIEKSISKEYLLH
ncbi:uncharacterized protein LOC134831876 [Culicoides brevitarsis]|uniref:uncharacterized protein LOC134831876 n=1 Tax=Culicoides brevitarsis TaxID=469753 RepID=UPI00307B2F8B